MALQRCIDLIKHRVSLVERAIETVSGRAPLNLQHMEALKGELKGLMYALKCLGEKKDEEKER